MYAGLSRSSSRASPRRWPASLNSLSCVGEFQGGRQAAFRAPASPKNSRSAVSPYARPCGYRQCRFHQRPTGADGRRVRHGADVRAPDLYVPGPFSQQQDLHTRIAPGEGTVEPGNGGLAARHLTDEYAERLSAASAAENLAAVPLREDIGRKPRQSTLYWPRCAATVSTRASFTLC